jgi:hypothetical protein
MSHKSSFVHTTNHDMPAKKKSTGPVKRRVATRCGKDVNKVNRTKKAQNKYPYTEKFIENYMSDHDGDYPSPAVFKKAVHKKLSRKGSGSPCEGGKKRTRVTSKPAGQLGPWLTFVAAARKEFEKVHKEKPKPTGLTQAIKAMKLWTAGVDGKPGKGDMAKLKQVITSSKFKKIAMEGL